MSKYKIKIPKGSYNYYEEVLKNIEEFLKSLNKDDFVEVSSFLDFIEKIKEAL